MNPNGRVNHTTYNAPLPHMHALQALGGAGDELIGLEPVRLQ
jgi:hypothetical protein